MRENVTTAKEREGGRDGWRVEGGREGERERGLLFCSLTLGSKNKLC